MMRQQSFQADDFEKYRKPTRKEIFLNDYGQEPVPDEKTIASLYLEVKREGGVRLGILKSEFQ